MKKLTKTRKTTKTTNESLTKKFQDLGLVMKPEDLDDRDKDICALKALNKKDLIDTINANIDINSFLAKHPDANYLHVALSGDKLGCPGCSADYKTEADVPEHSIPCICGNPKHWLIKYEEE